MKRFIGILCIFSFATVVSTVPHSLWLFATYILGETALPEFSLVLMLDDVQMGHYDPNKMRYIPQRSKEPGSENREAEYEDIGSAFEILYTDMKYRAVRLKHCLNQTEGIHVLQRLAKCEIVNGVPGLTMTNNSFNGLRGDDLIYDVHEDSFQVKERWPSECYRTKSEETKWQMKIMYHPVCIKYLTKYLKEESNLVVRRVKPTLRLLKKTLTNSGGIRVTCLATGFYPRHINLTLLRDDQPASEDQVTGGILLPNGDDTYQMRKSVEVSAEELRQHSYNCRVTHLSLNTSLDITFDGDDFPATVSTIIYVVVALLVLVMICIISFIIWRKRAGSEQSCQAQYFAPSATQDNNPSEEDLLQ